MGKQLLHVDVIGDINLLHILYHVLYFVETHILRKKRLPSFVQGFKEIELESLILYTLLNQTRTALSYKFDNRT